MFYRVITQADLTDTWLKTPGQWRVGLIGQGKQMKRTATMSCPDCGNFASLSNHIINGVGQVSPSMVCPNKECNFHEYITLEGWKPNAKVA